VSFGADAGLDFDALLLDWFGARLQSKPEPPAAPVRIFVMGIDRWRDEAEWPLDRAQPTDVYLDSAGSANTAHGDGTLAWTVGGGAPDRFLYDPWDPVPCGAGEGYSRTPANPRLSEKRRDILVYTSGEFAEPLEVTGPVALALWAASSARDTDFTAKLLDVGPDGTERTLTDGILRARYRSGKTVPELLVPGEAVELKLDLGATSNVFRAGHRMRLELSSSCFPRFDRNPNTGGPFGKETELLVAEQTVFHDAARPSRLVLPVVRQAR
jgi:putative CocE/NonD family hydrolase